MVRRVMHLSVLAVIVLSATTLGAQETNDTDKLRQRVQILERKVAQLEDKVAQLEPLLHAYRQQKRARDELEEIGGVPGPIASTGKPVSASTELSVGQALQARDGDEWYAARVVQSMPDGQVRIHYVGWPSEFDETVTRSRLQLDPDAISKARKVVEEANLGLGTLRPSGLPVSEQLPLIPGQRVRIEWGGQWWAGEVVIVRADGKVKVHYQDWDSSWDEFVPRSRLQLEPVPKTAE